MEAEDYEKQMSYWTIIQGEKSIYQKASEAIKAYEEIMKKSNKSQIDLKLLNSIDPRVKKLF